MEQLKKLKILIDEEIELYEALSRYFEEKRQVLIANDVEGLLSVDDKILNTVDAIKAVVKSRMELCSLFGDANMGVSRMIEEARKCDPELADGFLKAKEKIQSLTEEIAAKERIIKELLYHGMKIVTKTLGVISGAVSSAEDYNSLGQNTHSNIDKISSIVEEV